MTAQSSEDRAGYFPPPARPSGPAPPHRGEFPASGRHLLPGRREVGGHAGVTPGVTVSGLISRPASQAVNCRRSPAYARAVCELMVLSQPVIPSPARPPAAADRRETTSELVVMRLACSSTPTFPGDYSGMIAQLASGRIISGMTARWKRISIEWRRAPLILQLTLLTCFGLLIAAVVLIALQVRVAGNGVVGCSVRPSSCSVLCWRPTSRAQLK